MVIREYGFTEYCKGVLLDVPRRFVDLGVTIQGQPCPPTYIVLTFSFTLSFQFPLPRPKKNISQSY